MSHIWENKAKLVQIQFALDQSSVSVNTAAIDVRQSQEETVIDSSRMATSWTDTWQSDKGQWLHCQ